MRLEGSSATADYRGRRRRDWRGESAHRRSSSRPAAIAMSRSALLLGVALRKSCGRFAPEPLSRYACAEALRTGGYGTLWRVPQRHPALMGQCAGSVVMGTLVGVPAQGHE